MMVCGSMVALLSACQDEPSSTSRPLPSVYAAVVDHVYQGNVPSEVLVLASTLIFCDPAASDEGGGASAGAQDSLWGPTHLRTGLSQISSVPVETRPIDFGTGTRLISGGEAHRLKQGRDTKATSLAVSPIFFDADDSKAFVYVEFQCWSLCGFGSGLELERKPEGWQVKRDYTYWTQ